MKAGLKNKEIPIFANFFGINFKRKVGLFLIIGQSFNYLTKNYGISLYLDFIFRLEELKANNYIGLLG
jgi:hypothetical protein